MTESAVTAGFKFGAHQFLWKSHWTDQDLGILDTAKSLGLDLFEISSGDDVQFDRARLRRHAEALRIELTVGPGNLWPMDCNISDDDPDARRKGIAWHRKHIERSAELGAVGYCGAIYSRPGHVCRRRPLADEMPRTAEHLRELAEHAQRHGLRVVIEPMSRFRVHLLNTAQQTVELVRLAGHPNLGINLDTYHMITEERDYGAAIGVAAPVLWGVHACENDRGVPGGGLVPWDSVFDALVRITSCKRLLLETYNTGPSEFGFSRGIFQDVCPNPEEFVRQGIAFLRDGVARAAARRREGLGPGARKENGRP
jgi:D-psicose/D-tagatose/L-ribulose 3-epimerase